MTNNLNPVQFLNVAHVGHTDPTAEGAMDVEWEDEHSDVYPQHGGPEGYVNSLAADIRRKGQKSPIEVTRWSSGDEAYTVLDGNHRMEALRRAGIKTVKAYVR